MQCTSILYNSQGLGLRIWLGYDLMATICVFEKMILLAHKVYRMLFWSRLCFRKNWKPTEW